MLARLADEIRGQTVQPRAWIIVDNGSTDGTDVAARELAAHDRWISVLSVEGPKEPTRGGPVVTAFEAGLCELADFPDVVVKLDADVSLVGNYFERLLEEFEGNSTLGIAAGTRVENDDGRWRVRHVTGTMVRAQARAYRSDCLRGVLPLERCVGWDHVDQLKANIRGWETREIPDLYFKHLRRDGARDGTKFWYIQGEAAHYLGYRPSYLLARTLHRARNDPGALRMIVGYVNAAVRGKGQSSDRWVLEKVRDQQRLSRLPLRINELHGR